MGNFTWSWNSGTTEGTFILNFTAQVPDQEESTLTPFTIVVDGTEPYLSTRPAKVSEPSGSAPTTMVSFNEAVVVSNISLFTSVPGFWTVVVLSGTSIFTLTTVQLADDQKIVTLTGNWTNDEFIAGEHITGCFYLRRFSICY